MLKSPLFPIFLIVTVDVLGLTIILPLLPIYAEGMGASPFVVGLLVSAYGLCQFIAGPILGQISDRWGRRPVLLVSQAGTFVGFLILAFADNLALVFLSRIIDGITAGNISVAQAYISDVSQTQNRARAFGLIGAAFSIGFLMGPTFSGFLAGYGHQVPIFAAACLSALSIAATYFFLPSAPPTHTDASRRVTDVRAYFKAFQIPGVSGLLFQFLAFTFAFSIFMSGFALFAERRFYYQGRPFGVQEIGYALGYMGLIGIIVQTLVLGKLIAFFREARLVSLGFLCMIFGFGLLGKAPSIPFLLLSITLAAFGSSVLRPSVISLVTQRVGRHEQGITLGLVQALLSVSQVVGPMVGGLFIQHGYLAAWAWFAAATSFVGWVLARNTENAIAKQM